MHHIPIIIFPPPPDLILWDAAWLPYLLYAIGFACLLFIPSAVKLLLDRIKAWWAGVDREIESIRNFEYFDGEDHAERSRQFEQWKEAHR